MSIPSDPRIQKPNYCAFMLKKPMELPVPGPYECSSNDRCFKVRKMEGPPYSETPKRFVMKINNRRYRGYPMARTRGLKARKLTYPPEKGSQDGYDENKRIVLKIIFGKGANRSETFVRSKLV